MKNIPRILFFLLGLSMFVLGCATLAYGIRRGYLAVAPGVAIILTASTAGLLKRSIPRLYKYLSRITAVCVLAVTAAFVIASIQILTCYFNDKDIPSNAPVVVLGCGLSPVDNISPSLMLALRLQAAELYLNENPQAKCILTGGQGADELIPEALSMFKYLVERGIEPERLYMENKSSSTAENLSFAKQIAEENGLELNEAVIVTDGFHEFRAHRIARSLDIVPYTVSSRAPFVLTAFYWVRETAGIVIQVWLGL